MSEGEPTVTVTAANDAQHQVAMRPHLFGRGRNHERRQLLVTPAPRQGATATGAVRLCHGTAAALGERLRLRICT